MGLGVYPGLGCPSQGLDVPQRDVSRGFLGVHAGHEGPSEVMGDGVSLLLTGIPSQVWGLSMVPSMVRVLWGHQDFLPGDFCWEWVSLQVCRGLSLLWGSFLGIP